MEDNRLAQLPQALLPWYEKNRRDLPWRQDREPYHVWLSEIMLQQTRVEAVKGYYTRFLEALPTIEALAKAPQEQLYKLWEGLGYYSRVRNLQKAAKVLCAEYGGQMPGDYQKVRALPGIGPYTAGAICSIAFNLPTPAVDGNVLRVISRLENDATPIDLPACKKAVEEKLRRIYPAEAGDFTQALMELGATACGPNREPDCVSCPCTAFCRGRIEGTARELPVRLPKKERRSEDLTVFILRREGKYAVCRRGAMGLLAGLWEFPNVPGKLTLPQEVKFLEDLGFGLRQVWRQVEKKHIFTHIQWNMQGFYAEVTGEGGDWIWLTLEEIEKGAALPTAFRQFWEEREDV